MDYPETRVVRHRDLSPNVNGNGEVKPMEHVAPVQEKLEIDVEKGIKEVL